MPFIVIQAETSTTFTVCVRDDLRSIQKMARRKPLIRSEEFRKADLHRYLEACLNAMEDLQLPSAPDGRCQFIGSLIYGASLMMSSTLLMPFKVPIGRNG